MFLFYRRMSHVVCPLCGLSVPLSAFWRGEVSEEVEVVSFRGLGRAKGFEKIIEGAASEEVCSEVASRCRIILEGLGVDLSPPAAAVLRSEIEVSEVEIEEVKEEVDTVRGEMQDILNKINEGFKADFEYLIDAVEFLLEQLL